MRKEPLQLEGHCYVLLQGDWIHPIAYKRQDFVWYPERSLTLLERHNYRPYLPSVVTENAWIIGCYDREKVRVLDDETGQWTWPDIQTYGASVNHVTCSILGIQSTIPAQVLDGGKEIKELIEKYGKLVELANKA